MIHSLIIPTRNRLDLLKTCIASFLDRAHYPDAVEILLMVDYDAIPSFLPPVQCKMIVQHRSSRMIQTYNNLGSLFAQGRFVWMLGDDAEMTTDAWDKIMHDRAEAFLADKPDRNFYGYVHDDTHNNPEYGCCFPVVSKEAINRMGGIMPEEIDSWGADIFLYKIFRLLAENRILDLRDEIKLLHHCRHNGRRAPDETAKHVERVSRRAHLSHKETARYVNRLMAYSRKANPPLPAVCQNLVADQ